MQSGPLTWYGVNVDLSMQCRPHVAAVYVKLIRERGSVLYGIAKEPSNLPIMMYQHDIVTKVTKSQTKATY